jgi:hypothetical protein
MADFHQQELPERRLRNFMGVAAALCVLGLASLVWLHNSPEAALSGIASRDAMPDAARAPMASQAVPTATGVPSAESVFRDAPYIAPEQPIAQF